MTPQEFSDKCAWEGGFLEGLRYGLTAKHLDPEYKDERALIDEAHILLGRLEAIEDLFPDADEG